MILSNFKDYNELLEKEEMYAMDKIEGDLSCYDTTDNGRQVRVCVCTSEKCNSSPPTKLTKKHELLAFMALTALAVFAYQ